MATLSIEYGKTRNNGSRSVMLHIRSGKTEKRIPLNVSIDKSEFRTYPDGRIKITNDDKYFYIQDSLSDYKVRMNNILREYIGVDLSAEDLYRLMIAPNKADVCNMDFFDFADEWLEKSDIKGKKVLIVDDTTVNQHIFKAMIAPYELEVHTAKDGQDALALMNENKFDIVFLDHMMPIMDGVETLHRLREIDEHYKSVPVIALTGNYSPTARAEYISMGFDDYLEKPIVLDSLEEILYKYL